MIFVPILIVIIIGLFFLEKLSIRYAFKGVGYDIKPKSSMVEVDEEFLVETTITNTKRFPVDYLRTAELMPDNICISGGDSELTAVQRGKALISDTYLLPRQKLTRTLKASVPKRGLYYFWGATLTAGSFLGFSERTMDFRFTRVVIAPPKRIVRPELDQLLGRYIGDISVNRFIMEDPILTIGFREYTEQDPMRSICWKQTARFGKLMVKNYDHTLDLTVTIIMNLDSAKTAGAETVFSITRTVCDFLETSEVPYRLVTNASVSGTSTNTIIPDGYGGDHYLSTLELLARAKHSVFESMEEMLAKIAKGAEQGRAHILITPEVQYSATAYLYKLRARTGKDVLVLTPESLAESESESAAV